jgi:hypothetical protein
MSCEFCKPKPYWKNFRFPVAGETVSWFGTTYKVIGSNEKQSTVTIVQKNEIEIVLHWTNTEGCEIK